MEFKDLMKAKIERTPVVVSNANGEDHFGLITLTTPEFILVSLYADGHLLSTRRRLFQDEFDQIRLTSESEIEQVLYAEVRASRVFQSDANGDNPLIGWTPMIYVKGKIHYSAFYNELRPIFDTPEEAIAAWKRCAGTDETRAMGFIDLVVKWKEPENEKAT